MDTIQALSIFSFVPYEYLTEEHALGHNKLTYKTNGSIIPYSPSRRKAQVQKQCSLMAFSWPSGTKE